MLFAIYKEYQKDLPDVVGNITPEKLNTTQEIIQIALNKLYYEDTIGCFGGSTLMSDEGVVLSNDLWPTEPDIKKCKLLSD